MSPPYDVGKLRLTREQSQRVIDVSAEPYQLTYITAGLEASPKVL